MLDIKNKLFTVADDSPALKRKVGAIITDRKCTKILATGKNYNLSKNSIYCENNEGETFDTVIHAEADVIDNLFKSGINSGKLAMYVTYSPCIECCKKMVSSGVIKYLYYFDEHAVNFRKAEKTSGSLSPIQFLWNSGIKVYKYNQKTKGFDEQKPIKSIGICHSKDADGFSCMFLLSNFYPKMDIYGYNYEEDSEWMHIVADNYIFADVCPTKNWLNQNIDRFKNHSIHITVFDHHKKTIENVKNWLVTNDISADCYKFIESDNEADSATKILYDWILNHIKNNEQYRKFSNIEYIINAISLYDTWHYKNDILTAEQKKAGYTERRILCLSELFKSWSFNLFDVRIGFIFNARNKKKIESTIESYIHDGSVLVNAHEYETENWLNSAVSSIFTVNNTETLLIFGTRYPDYYIEKYCKKIAISRNNILNKTFPQVTYISFYVDLKQQKLIFSVRTYLITIDKPLLSAYQIASKVEGGGGHELAGGFSLNLNDGFVAINNLSEFIQNLLS